MNELIEGSEIFYCNRPCKLITKMEHESLIELNVASVEVDEGYDEGSYIEPVYNKLIVDNKYLSASNIDWEIETDKRLREINQGKAAAKKDIETAREEAVKEIYEATEEVAKFKKRFALLGEIALTLEILEGENLYALIPEYRPEIVQIKDLMCHCDKDRLASIIIKRNDDTHRYVRDTKGFHFRLGHYSDGSGGNKYIQLYRSEKEAIEGAIEYFRQEKKWHEYIKFCKKYGIEMEEVQQAEKEQLEKTEANKLDEINKLEKKLLTLKS